MTKSDRLGTIGGVSAGLVAGVLVTAFQNNGLTFATMIVSGVMTVMLGVPTSRRVLVAWTTWASLRWRWRHRPQSLRRWLWVATLRHADGIPRKRDDR